MSEWLDAEAHADLALEMYERGRLAEAEAELRKALSLNPDQAEWHFNLALTLEGAGRDSEALACHERAIQLLPGQSEPLVAAGIVGNRLEQFDRAVVWFGQALRIDPRCEPAYGHKMESYVRLEQHDEVETTFYLAQQALESPSAHCLAVMAESLLRCKQYQRAEWCLKEALRLEPQLPRLRARLGAVFAATGRPQRALQMFLRDLRDDPGNIDTLLDYGELLVDLSRLPEAAEKYRRVLELEPANVDAHFRLGELALAARRCERAQLEFELVQKLDPRFPQIRLALADVLLRRGRVEQARQHLHHVLQEIRAADQDQPGPTTDLAQLGSLLLKSGLWSEAAKAFNQALDRHGVSAELLKKLALARFQAGDRPGGVAASRRVLRIEPECLAAMHNLALAALDQKHLRPAAGWIDRGLKIDRHDDGLRRLRMRLWFALAADLFRRRCRRNTIS
ncbi:MAG: tetratricopeptide repeat protein [Acidobacteria bacterium]|nr:tetratricopeptide repeat protein [Acidobacteriota bacterium]